ncbi:MAG: hypothetical protein EBZ36_12050 [Acidobacteria bacterium]|nr:hypothetical protein [Acidobacteriota bacterium]
MGELKNIVLSLKQAICLSFTFGFAFVLLGQSPSPRGTGEPGGAGRINDPVEALPTVVAESRQRLLAASQTYRHSLEKLLVLQTQDADRARVRLERSRKLLEGGLVPRRQVEAAELELNGAVARQSETARQIESLDSLVAEVHAAELAMRAAPAGQPVAGPLVRYVGTARWTVADVTRVDAFYRLKFGRSLPISALGQTETHQQLGFDHHDAADVAVHPDTPEGQELIVYLQSQGISFIAIREAIPGSATGAHIHIGPPSRRAPALR